MDHQRLMGITYGLAGVQLTCRPTHRRHIRQHRDAGVQIVVDVVFLSEQSDALT